MPEMFDSTVRAEWEIAWTPPKLQTVSEWADENFTLRRELSASPGRYRTERTPYLAGIMDCYADPHYSTICVPKSAQIGLTTAADIMLAWAASEQPGPMMYTYPTEDNVKYAVQNRLAPIFETPQLKRLRPYDGFATNKQIDLNGGTTIFMAWSGSPNTLTTKPVRGVFFDELENCDSVAGSLGDNYAVVSERTTTWPNRSKIVAYSTCSTPYGSLWRLWLTSDQRHYFVPCPLCGHYQRLVFDRIKVPEGMRDPQAIEIKNLAWYECESCSGHLIDSKHKKWMNLRGVWVSRGQDIVERLPIADPEIVERAHFRAADRWVPRTEGGRPLTRIAGFHIWSAYSPWRSWSLIAAKFFAWKDDRANFRVFVNSWLGEPWEEVASTVSPEKVRDRIGVLPRYIVPKEAMVLTAGVDLQYVRRRLYFDVRAWGPGCENWMVDHGFYACDTDRETMIEVLGRFYAEKFTATPYHRVGGEKVGPRIVMIDAGGEVARQVYEFCKTHLGAFSCKGESSNLSHYVRAANPEPRRTRKDAPHPLSARRLWLVNTDKCKDAMYSFAMKEGDGPNTMHLHDEVDDEWVNQFAAEHQVWDTAKKRLVWRVKSVGRANHYLDAAVLSLAGAEVVGALSLQRAEPVIRNPKDREPRQTYRDVLKEYSQSMI